MVAAPQEVSASYTMNRVLLTLTRLQAQAPAPGGPLTHITFSPDQLAWIFEPGQFDSAPLQYTPVDRSGPGEIVPYSAPNFVAFNGPPVVPMYVSPDLGPWKHDNIC